MCASGQLGGSKAHTPQFGNKWQVPALLRCRKGPPGVNRRAAASLSAGLSKADCRAYAGRRALTSMVVARLVASLVPVSHPRTSHQSNQAAQEQ